VDFLASICLDIYVDPSHHLSFKLNWSLHSLLYVFSHNVLTFVSLRDSAGVAFDNRIFNMSSPVIAAAEEIIRPEEEIEMNTEADSMREPVISTPRMTYLPPTQSNSMKVINDAPLKSELPKKRKQRMDRTSNDEKKVSPLPFPA
jgi:hypothetical protein